MACTSVFAMLRRFLYIFILFFCFFFFSYSATSEIYTLSLHDALPIYGPLGDAGRSERPGPRVSHSVSRCVPARRSRLGVDRVAVYAPAGRVMAKVRPKHDAP